MDTVKQQQVIECLNNSRYKVNIYTGDIFFYSVAKAQWKIKQPVIIKGYKQYQLFKGRGKGKGIVAYGHNIVWLSKNGLFAPEMVIDHKNNNPGDNRICNLQLMTASNNKKKSPTFNHYQTRVKGDQLKELLRLSDSIINYCELSRITGIRRTTLMYLVKHHRAGDKLRYIDWKEKDYK